MSIIYEPKGKAREYSPLSANLYNGCNHGCLYCYAPGISNKKIEECMNPVPRRNVLSELEKDCRANVRCQKSVLLCFMTDPYNCLEKEYRITRETLKLFLKYQIPCSLLTKSGNGFFADYDVIEKMESHVAIGATLVFSKDEDRKKFEPNAAKTNERVKGLSDAKKKGITTWASFEPVLFPDQSLQIIEKCLELDCLDIFKLGKVNNFKYEGGEFIDWSDYLTKALDLIRSAGKRVYVKNDLAAAANVTVKAIEREPDAFHPPAWK
jgi:DNA repair photolyase